MSSGSNVLSEYLVALGFSTDQASFTRFVNVLRDASSVVDNEYLEMAKKVIEFEVATVSAFAAVGAAALKIADDVAMSDQGYRLFALHMYTSLPVARELKIGLDALGASLGDVQWDPELAQRFTKLVEDQAKLTEELGPGFEAQMLKIRDVRFEFTRLGVEVQYVTMMLVNDLAKAFGTDIDGLFKKLHDFNDWLIDNAPAISDWLATNLKPILLDVREILEDTWDTTKQFLITFTNLVGTLTGDTSLEGATLDFKKLTKAIQETADGITKVIVNMLKLESNLALLFDAANQASQHNYAAAYSDLEAMHPIDTPGATKGTTAAETDAVLQAFPTTVNLWERYSVPLGIVSTRTLAAAHEKLAAWPYAVQAGLKLGIPPDIIFSQWEFETGGMRQLSADNNLAGIKIPGTDKFQSFASLQDFMDRYVSVLNESHYKGIQGSQTIDEFAAILKRGGYYDKTAEQYAAGLKYFDTRDFPDVSHPDVSHSTTTNTVSITIHAGAGSDPKKISDATFDAVSKALDKLSKNQTQRNIAEFETPGYSY